MIQISPRKPRGLRPAILAASLLLTAPAAALTTAENDVPASLSGSYLAARTADVEKDTESAAGFYRQALEEDPENTYLLERSLILTASSGDFDAAMKFAKTLLQKQPENHPARLLTAIEEIRTEKYAEAAKTLAEKNPGVLAAGRTAEAIEKLEKARAGDSNAVRVTEAYARALAVAGRKDEAEAALKDFLSNYPDNSLAVAALEDIRAGRGHVMTVATPVEGAAEALSGIGAAVGQEGGTEVALLYLRLALYLDPDIAGGLAALSLGNLLEASNQREAAILSYESIPADAPFRALGQMRAALALDGLDRTAEAEAAFKAAIAANADDIQSYISYGNMLRARERFAEAAEIYSQAIARIPTPATADWSLFYYRGISYERTDAWPKAEADFRKALELSPDQPLVMNYLGYSWVDKGINLEEGMEMIRKAVELRPNDGFIVDSLGWAHYRLGEYDEAVTELERAVGLKPDDPVINDHLGDAFWKAGRKLEAQFQWRHARDFGAEGPELELILKKIAEERLIEAGEKKDASLYTVQPGDSIWTISAALQAGDAYAKILDANKDTLKSPDQIFPGMQLVIPGDI